MFLNPRQIINHVTIPHGARVADFGTGAGHYATAALEKVGSTGAVYAFDAFAPSLDSLHRSVSHHGNLYTLTSDLNAHIPLADNLLKAGIAANILHQLRDRSRFVRELSRVLAPDGEALVVDWVSSFRNMGPPEGSVITPGEAARLFEEAGFSVGDMLPAGTHHFAFVAKNH